MAQVLECRSCCLVADGEGARKLGALEAQPNWRIFVDSFGDRVQLVD